MKHLGIIKNAPKKLSRMHFVYYLSSVPLEWVERIIDKC